MMTEVGNIQEMMGVARFSARALDTRGRQAEQHYSLRRVVGWLTGH